MNWQDLLAIINNGENNTTKFFGKLSSLDELGAAIVAMANTKGGSIFIGMDVKNYHLYGFNESQETISTLIQNHCRPRFNVTTDMVEKHGKTIFIIHVTDTGNRPYYFKNMCYVMDGKTPRLALVEKSNLPPEEERLDEVESTIPAPVSSPPVQTALELPSDVPSNQPDSAPVPEASTQDELGYSPQDLENITSELVELQETNEVDLTLASSFNDNRREEPAMASSPHHNQLNERQSEALEYIKVERSIKNKEYRELFNVSHKTAHLELVNMVEKGLIVTEGQGRSTHYVLTS